MRHVALIAALACAVPAQAQSLRTFVSGVGDDANACTRTAPCRTFAVALTRTAKDGEIDVLTPGSFGPMTITKSVTIDGGDGGGAAILADGVTAITVDITDVNDVAKTVRLRNLSINGVRTGTRGIHVTAAASVFIENVVVHGFTSNCIDDQHAAVANSTLSIRRASLSHCGGSAVRTAASGTGEINFVFDDVHAERSVVGFDFGNGSRGLCTRCVAANNTTGFATSEAVSGTSVTLESSAAALNGTGVNAGQSTDVLLLRSTITNNTTSLTGAIGTGGNNSIGLNSANTMPSGNSYPQN